MASPEPSTLTLNPSPGVDNSIGMEVRSGIGNQLVFMVNRENAKRRMNFARLIAQSKRNHGSQIGAKSRLVPERTKIEKLNKLRTLNPYSLDRSLSLDCGCHRALKISKLKTLNPRSLGQSLSLDCGCC